MAEAKLAHVLVVEDDERSRRMLTEALEGQGYYVTAVGSGERALVGADRGRSADGREVGRRR